MHQKISLVLLADGHLGLRGGVRGLRETEFDTVFMVADDISLLEGAGRPTPPIVALDLSLPAAICAACLPASLSAPWAPNF